MTSMPSTPSMPTARRAHQSDWVDRLAGFGLISFGVVHVVLGWLSVQLALGDREGTPSTTGAVQELADKPFGKFLVWAVAVGLVVLAAWQALEAAVGNRDKEGAKRLGRCAVNAGRAVVYAAIAVGAISVATGSSGGGGSKQTDAWTARLMSAPGGQVLVGLVALGIIGVGIGLIVVAVRGKHLESLQSRATRGSTGTVVTWLGGVGHIAKGLALGVIGGLFLYAAVTHEADKSGGLDQALRTMLDQPFGPFLLGGVGVGFAAYGVFCLVKARYLDR